MEFSKQISEVVDLCGRKVAKELCENYGGTKIYIRKEGGNSVLHLSTEAQEALEQFAGEFIEVPKSIYNEGEETSRIVIEMYQDGYRPFDIALAVERTERLVRKVLKKARDEGQKIPTHAERYKEKQEEARSLFKQGETIPDIAEKIKRHERFVRHAIGNEMLLTRP